MTEKFQAYTYRELVPSAPVAMEPEASPATATNYNAQTYVPPVFGTKKSATAVDVAHNMHVTSFALDPRVKTSLAVDEEEKQRAEVRIQEELERRWEILKSKAEVEGYAAGVEIGKREAVLVERQRIEERLGRMDSVINEISAVAPKIFAANEKFIIDLVMQLAEAVILREIEEDRDYLKRVLTEIVGQIGETDGLRILLSEDDKMLVDSLLTTLGREYGKLTNTVIEISPDLEKGSCRVETKSGVVDATIATQIRNLFSALRSA